LKFITTSWDDGSPADLRLAELLGKYNLQGTFYVPKQNDEHDVMSERDLLKLSKHFEIGGHTLSHKSLKKASRQEIDFEVNGSFNWLSEILNEHPVSFCLPYGHYNNKCIELIHKSGFRYIRTTELLSASDPSLLSHTTLQVFQHSRLTYFKHLLKRGRFKNLGLWIQGGSSENHFRLLDYYLDYIHVNGGCFHLWGHSWEIEELQLWNRLELIFKRISNQQGFQYVKNRDLIARA
jgi:peptidoglycan/xylan/chitin deacetylase (PgdA/CDA1 family)